MSMSTVNVNNRLKNQYSWALSQLSQAADYCNTRQYLESSSTADTLVLWYWSLNSASSYQVINNNEKAGQYNTVDRILILWCDEESRKVVTSSLLWNFLWERFSEQIKINSILFWSCQPGTEWAIWKYECTAPIKEWSWISEWMKVCCVAVYLKRIIQLNICINMLTCWTIVIINQHNF